MDVRHNELFGLPEDQKMTEEERVDLYTALTDYQKNILKRDFIIHAMSNTSGVSKKSTLLIELVKYHFPEDMAEIESKHNEEYLKKRKIIQERMDKINAKKSDLQEGE